MQLYYMIIHRKSVVAWRTTETFEIEGTVSIKLAVDNLNNNGMSLKSLLKHSTVATTDVMPPQLFNGRTYLWFSVANTENLSRSLEKFNSSLQHFEYIRIYASEIE